MIREFCNWLWVHTPPAWDVQAVQTKEGHASVRIHVRTNQPQDQGGERMEIALDRMWTSDIVRRYRGGIQEFARICAEQLRTDMDCRIGDAYVINSNVHREDYLRPGEASS